MNEFSDYKMTLKNLISQTNHISHVLNILLNEDDKKFYYITTNMQWESFFSSTLITRENLNGHYIGIYYCYEELNEDTFRERLSNNDNSILEVFISMETLFNFLPVLRAMSDQNNKV